MFRWREIEEEGERAARPCVRSVSGKPKEKEKKKLTRKMSLFGLMGRTKNSRKTRRRLFLSTDWSKSVLSASAKQREDCGLFDPGTGGLFALYRRRFAVYISLYL